MLSSVRRPRLDKEALFADLGYVPHDRQWEVHRSRKPRRVLACGVRWGKTTAAAMEAIAGALMPRGRAPTRGWVVAPTYDLADKVFREIVLVAHEKVPHRVVVHRDNERLIKLTNAGGGECELRGKTAENPVSLLGEGLDFLIVDEAARLKPDVWERYLAARLIDKKGWALLISTPRGKGWYYDAWRRGQDNRDPLWQSWNAPSESNPHLDPTEIEAVRQRIPSAVFAQEYLAEFIEGAGQVFRRVRDLATAPWGEPIKGKRYVSGLDLAKVEDWTVQVVIEEESRAVVALDRYNRIDWEIQAARVKAMCEKWNGAQVLVDSTGVGEPIYDGLVKAGVRARGYKFTTQSKADLVNNLAMMLEQGKVTLPRADLAPELIDELEAYQYEVTASGHVTMGAPPGQHDDAATALMLAAWLVRKDRAPLVARWV